VYPSPEKVRDEVLQTLKGLVTATFCPSLALFLAQRGVSQGYCGVGDHGWGYLAATFVMSWIFIDFFEVTCMLVWKSTASCTPGSLDPLLQFFYHHLGHTHAAFWAQHKAHHVFFNPSPFAVIADDFVDQFVRS
jgi:Delta7-sterol 5-desaturase